MNRNPVRGAARLAAILDALPDALLLVDSSGSVVNANAAALEMFEGESAERLLGKTIVTLLPGFGRSPAVPGAGPAALPAGSTPAEPAEPAGSGPPEADAETPTRGRPERLAARRTDGRLFPAEVTSSTLPGDEDDLTLLVVRDLSGQLDLEAELRRQQRQIELILRAASEGIVGVDHEGRIVLVNPAGAKILRHRASDLGGQDAHELIAHSTADGVPIPPEQFLLIDSLRTGAKHHSVDETLWRSDGSPVAVDITTAPVYEGEAIIGAVMTFADNSEMRAATRRAEELAAILDDQLRAPLAGVLSDLREVAEYGIGELGPAVRQALASISADLGEVAGLVDDIVDYQQMVVGRVSGELEIQSLSDLIETAAGAAQDTAASMGVQIAVHAAEVPVPVDADLFPKLLAHLLADMVTATPVGGKIVMTGARRGPVARIEIRGPHTGGGPLHVPIARAIAARHGGTVTTHRIVGKGNTHVVEVPIEVAAGTTARPARAVTAGPAALPATASANGTAPRTANGSESAGHAPAAQSAAQEQTAAANGTAGHERRAAAAGGAGATGSGTGTQVVEKTNGHHTSHGADRRRAGHPEQAKIPPQSRSTLSRALGTDLLDLKPSKPLPTSDVWARPARQADASGPSVPGEPEQPQQPQQHPDERPPQPVRPERAAQNGYAAADPIVDAPLYEAEPTLAETEQPQAAAPQGPSAPSAAAGQATPAGTPTTTSGSEEAVPRGRRRAANQQAAAPAPVEPTPAPPATAPAEQAAAGGQPEVNGQPFATQGGFPHQQQPAQQQGRPHQGYDLPGTPDDQVGYGGQAANAGPQGYGAPAAGNDQVGYGGGNAPAPAQPGLSAPLGYGALGAQGAAAVQSGTMQSDAMQSGSAQTGSAQQQAAADQFGYGGRRGYGAAPAPQQPVPGGRQFGGRAGFIDEPEPATPEQPGFPQQPEAAAQPAYGARPPYDPQFGIEQQRTATPAVEPWSAAPAAQPQPPNQQAGLHQQGLQQAAAQQHGMAQPHQFPHQQPVTLPPTATPPQTGSAPAVLPFAQPAPGHVTRADGSEPTVAIGGGLGPNLSRAMMNDATMPGIAMPGSIAPVPAAPMSAVPMSATNAGPTAGNPGDPAEGGPGPRLLLWPQPDPTTLGLLAERGYRTNILDSPESFPAGPGAPDAGGTRAVAVLVDPIAAPITRRGLRSLRGAAIDAGLPILVTAGIGCAPTSSQPGPGPELLVHALTPSAVAMPRVLLVEGRQDLAEALARALGGQGIQVLQAATDNESVARANDAVPDVVVLDLMQVRRRRVGIIEWLQDHRRLEMTPIVVYTALGTDSEHFAGLSSGSSALYLAERSTDGEVGNRLTDLLAKTAGAA